MRFDSVILIKIRRQARIKCVCRFCGNVPLQIPPAAVSRFKFRLWNSRCVSCDSKTVGLYALQIA
ncbi:hypothetical protein EUBSIR_02291 [[Eubacterium] siraeum DSM 15702]|uniref:Uncharacterized protein n=1 Tax=[Eubacterium] siraeum DSM 15702 TaxID=428128 RepID=B0MR24_9FIRM|nr:hypothetical protein EUBSIR_02291 [[Eubacterium] siraeum DSM 15702]